MPDDARDLDQGAGGTGLRGKYFVSRFMDLLQRFRSLASCTGAGVADTFEVLHREVMDVALAELVRQVSQFLPAPPPERGRRAVLLGLVLVFPW